ncbi:MAG: hypothetical protein PUA56_03750 [Bacillales bacterium]|nr:hypothetical protein [Bacillales bacterium]
METKYPIILVHGIAIKDLFFIKSFGQIDRILRIEGFKVYKSNVDSFGSIENNAEILKKEILEIMEKEKVDKVNIIAHSKGGLDSKYMIVKLQMSQYIASFTTLCTPHYGSPIATNILRLPRWILKFIAFWFNFWYRIFGDKNPDALKVCEQLAEVNSVEEETFLVDSSIYCQSYSTKLNKSRDDFIMGIPLMFYHYFDKKNECDGLVSIGSSKFGEYKGNAFQDSESVSHSEIIDFMVKRKKKDKIYAFYSYICEDLKNRGF